MGLIFPPSLLLPQAYLIYSSSVAAGAQSGIEECKYQFAWDRWNCPERALQLSTHSSLRSGKYRVPQRAAQTSPCCSRAERDPTSELETCLVDFEWCFKKCFVTVCLCFCVKREVPPLWNRDACLPTLWGSYSGHGKRQNKHTNPFHNIPQNHCLYLQLMKAIYRDSQDKESNVSGSTKSASCRQRLEV